MAVKLFCITIILFFLTGCSNVFIETPRKATITPQALTVFIDGTANNPESNTNVIKLHNLKKEGIASFYTEGVGNGYKVLGMALGIGSAKRVRESYYYLCKNYQKGDSIFLFGFSRGAYASRILSNLIYTAGILDMKSIPKTKEQKKIIKKMYNRYRTKKTADTRSDILENYITSWNKKHVNINQAISQIRDVDIEVMGLWETVEAFRFPDCKEGDFCHPNENHLYQVCNIKKVFHAVALDDNRAKLYTPILLTHKNIADCRDSNISINKKVDEVWFSGAHSDIGGGYKENPEMADVALNWMISKLRPYPLFRDTTIINNYLAPIHDAESMPLMKILSRRINRNMNKYYDSTAGFYNNGKLKIHESVIQRLKEGLAPCFKLSKKNKLDWFDMPPFSDCFDKDDKKRIYKGCDCLEIIKND